MYFKIFYYQEAIRFFYIKSWIILFAVKYLLMPEQGSFPCTSGAVKGEIIYGYSKAGTDVGKLPVGGILCP